MTDGWQRFARGEAEEGQQALVYLQVAAKAGWENNEKRGQIKLKLRYFAAASFEGTTSEFVDPASSFGGGGTKYRIRWQ